MPEAMVAPIVWESLFCSLLVSSAPSNNDYVTSAGFVRKKQNILWAYYAMLSILLETYSIFLNCLYHLNKNSFSFVYFSRWTQDLPTKEKVLKQTFRKEEEIKKLLRFLFKPMNNRRSCDTVAYHPAH